MDIKTLLLGYFNKKGYRPLRIRELAEEFGVQESERKEFEALLEELARAGKIRVSAKGRIKPASRKQNAKRAEERKPGFETKPKEKEKPAKEKQPKNKADKINKTGKAVKSDKADKTGKEAHEKAPESVTLQKPEVTTIPAASAAAKRLAASEEKAEKAQGSEKPAREDAAFAPKRAEAKSEAAAPAKAQKQDAPKKQDMSQKQAAPQSTAAPRKPEKSAGPKHAAPRTEVEKRTAAAREEADERILTSNLPYEIPEMKEGPVREDEGVIRANARGFAFFRSDGDIEDVFIAGDDLHGALNGDRVRIKISRKAEKDGGKNAEGEVVKILERSHDVIVGTFDIANGKGIVRPDDRRFIYNIAISRKESKSLQRGDRVIVSIEHFDRGDVLPVGHIEEVLGHESDAGVDVTAIARVFGLASEFSPETLAEAKAFPKEVLEEDKRGRKDYRKLFTVTIDGADSKDFDDAFSVEKRGSFYNLYVHIADVSHYVKPGSAVDADAFERGNSVYLLDRVIPMLPEELSNGLCSLNPGVDRLAVTTRMTFNEKGELVDYWFFNSVIRSDRRLIYKDVSDYLEKDAAFEGDKKLRDMLDLANELYELLAEQRIRRGAIDFNFPETKITLDPTGKPIDVRPAERRTANRLIEEFMIANNETVGTHFFGKKLPFVYRVHDLPDEARMERLNNALKAFRYPTLPMEPTPAEIRKVLDLAAGTKEEGVLSTLILTTMAKAEYRRSPGIHFGLGIDHYSHFTSPIRRYADLICHRLLKRLIANEPVAASDGVNGSLDEACRHISDTERRAEEAERDVVDMKCAEYMAAYVGETFPGTVTSLTNFGVFITLENSVEGLAHFRDMTDDYYTYDPDKFVVRGERTKREIRYGDVVQILVTRSNPVMREIDFQIQHPGEHHGSSRPERGDRKGQPRGAQSGQKLRGPSGRSSSRRSGSNGRRGRTKNSRKSRPSARAAGFIKKR